MNAERNWTPGPWELGDLDAAGQRMVRQEYIEICTCWHHSVGSIEKEMEANAHLIAAAPDMYEALKEFVAAAERSGVKHDALRNRVERARAALAKADGRQP